MVRQRVALGPFALAAEAVEEPERRQRLEDRRPHGVEVDARRHHGEVHLVGGQFGGGDVADVDRLARVLVVGRDALEHGDVVTLDERGPDSDRGSAGWRCRHRWRPTGWPRGWCPSAARYRSVNARPKPHRRSARPPRRIRWPLRFSGPTSQGYRLRMAASDSASGSYIIAGARTPIGKLSGALASFSAADLGGFAISAALERAGVAPDEVDHVIMGQVLMAGPGPGAEPPGGGQGRHPDERPVDQHQQGLPVGPQHRSISRTR